LAANQTATGQGSATDSGSSAPGASQTVTFQTASRLNLNVNASQDSSRTGSSDEKDKKPEAEFSPEEARKYLEELLKSLKDFSKYFTFPLISAEEPAAAPPAPKGDAPLPEEETAAGMEFLGDASLDVLDPA